MAEVRAVELRVPVAGAGGAAAQWWIAATVFVPGDGVAGAVPVLVLLPGGGYNRRYFDLPVDGFSQARHHAERGMVVVAMDHLGVGDSAIPPVEVTDLATVAAANHVAVVDIVGRLRSGSLAPDLGPVQVGGVVGAGQSLGGHMLLGMQAYHRTFDAVAFLGSSMAGTLMPVRPGQSGTGMAASVEERLANTDFVWAFHWEEATEADLADPPHDLVSLVAADITGGMPARHTPPPWGTDRYPGCSALGMVPDGLAAEAAAVDVPVLLGMGERDVCHPPGVEVARLKAATDISVFVVPQSAHMHNFSVNRRMLWERLDAFVGRVTGRS